MCDEAGCNFNAINKVYGQEFQGQTVTCQFHFKNCAKNKSKTLTFMKKKHSNHYVKNCATLI